MFNVLFLCTGNSARSIMAEVLLNNCSDGRFKAYSAGSKPAGKVNPIALELLNNAQLQTEGLRSKSWDEFSQPGAPHMDLIITVCDSAKGEVCPTWPGHPALAHWGIEDPVVAGSDDVKPFKDALRYLENRIRLFAELPVEKLEHLKLQQHLQEIAALDDADDA
ncbi:arsenate reductase ArsC [Hydrogenovibrio kuenenii]|uniref:arsenate reductase ArsC n=1 Tax=Hydrogenovibrio kuenenii TaxID=63658 RepID=UPI000464FE43|nr:arsenate reductase ArsC [Hydrogenovibrio kuenenii]